MSRRNPENVARLPGARRLDFIVLLLELERLDQLLGLVRTEKASKLGEGQIHVQDVANHHDSAQRDHPPGERPPEGAAPIDEATDEAGNLRENHEADEASLNK